MSGEGTRCGLGLELHFSLAHMTMHVARILALLETFVGGGGVIG